MSGVEPEPIFPNPDSAHTGDELVGPRADFDHRAAVFGPPSFHRLGVGQWTAALGNYPRGGRRQMNYGGRVGGIVTSRVKCPSFRVQFEVISPRMLLYDVFAQLSFGSSWARSRHACRPGRRCGCRRCSRPSTGRPHQRSNARTSSFPGPGILFRASSRPSVPRCWSRRA